MHGSLVLDGASLTPNAVALIARDGAPVEVSAEARARNDDALPSDRGHARAR